MKKTNLKQQENWNILQQIKGNLMYSGHRDGQTFSLFLSSIFFLILFVSYFLCHGKTKV